MQELTSFTQTIADVIGYIAYTSITYSGNFAMIVHTIVCYIKCYIVLPLATLDTDKADKKAS